MCASPFNNHSFRGKNRIHSLYLFCREMKRGKTVMKMIEDTTSRQVTFSKRRNGLLKKAFELSVLCDVEVGLVIFSPRGRLCEFSKTSMKKMFDRYMMHTERISDDGAIEHDVQWELDAARMSKNIKLLEAHKQKLMGGSLESCSLEELDKLEGQLEQSFRNIRSMKYKLVLEQISQLKEKIQEKTVLERNAHLHEMCKEDIQLPLVAPKEIVKPDGTAQQIDVETDLHI